jgi:hypothetical protein
MGGFSNAALVEASPADGVEDSLLPNGVVEATGSPLNALSTTLWESSGVDAIF